MFAMMRYIQIYIYFTLFCGGCCSAPIDRVFIVVGEMVTSYNGVEPRRDAVFVDDRPTPTRCVADALCRRRWLSGARLDTPHG